MSGIFEKIKAHLTEDKIKTVYRFISEREKAAIEANDMSGIGSAWEKNNRRSSHKYKNGVRYVHFLDSKKDAMDIYNELKRSKRYLCTYNIPASVLKKYSGKGFYPPHGYDFSHTEIKEYAVPSTEYNPDWLVSMISTSEFLKDEGMDKL